MPRTWRLCHHGTFPTVPAQVAAERQRHTMEHGRRRNLAQAVHLPQAMVELLGVAIIKTDATNHDDNGRPDNNPENDLVRYKNINYIFRHTDLWPKIYS